MKINKIGIFVALCALHTAQAQISSDAYLFSNNQNRITARSLGVGNAMAAIGGDVSVANTNPAGLGVNKKSEFILSPQLSFGNTQASFSGESLDQSRAGFAIGSAALLLSNPLDGKWKTFNFLISYNKLNSFNQSTSYSGVSYGSRLQRFAIDANGSRPFDLNPLESGLAYDTYLIDAIDTVDWIYVPAIGDSNFVRKSQFIKQSGSNQELGISAAANYNNKLFIGGTLGISVLRYKEFKSYEELEETNSIDFKTMVFDENRTIKGTGVNFKGGLLYKFNQYFRMGLHVHTPTLFKNTETYSTEMFGRIMYNGNLQQNTFPSAITGTYLYTLRTPWLLGLSAGAVLGTKGFISAEAEYLNYKKNNFGIAANDTSATVSTRRYMDNLNRNVEGVYKGAFRFRIGGEIVANPAIRLRAGYQLQTSPYQVAIDGVSDLSHMATVGFGVRKEGFFFDLAYSHFLSQFQYSPYAATSFVNTQNITAKSSIGLISLTFGFRFI